MPRPAGAIHMSVLWFMGQGSSSNDAAQSIDMATDLVLLICLAVCQSPSTTTSIVLSREEIRPAEHCWRWEHLDAKAEIWAGAR